VKVLGFGVQHNDTVAIIERFGASHFRECGIRYGRMRPAREEADLAQCQIRQLKACS
jgi:hypothetical protein